MPGTSPGMTIALEQRSGSAPKRSTSATVMVLDAASRLPLTANPLGFACSPQGESGCAGITGVRLTPEWRLSAPGAEGEDADRAAADAARHRDRAAGNAASGLNGATGDA